MPIKVKTKEYLSDIIATNSENVVPACCIRVSGAGSVSRSESETGSSNSRTVLLLLFFADFHGFRE